MSVGATHRDPWEPPVRLGQDEPLSWRGRAPGSGPSQVSAVVVGAIGGAGATTVACAIAMLSAARGEPVTLVELDLERGDLSGSWDVPSDRTIDDLAPVADELQPHHVDLVALRHPEGPRVVLAPRRAGAAVAWTPSRAAALIDATLALGPVVVDAGASLGAHIQCACTRLGRAVVVSPPTLAGARGVRAIVGTLRSWQPGIAIALVANHGVGRDHLGAKAFARAAGHAVTAAVPRSDRDADDCRGGRWRLRGKGSFRRAIEQLAEEVARP